MPTFPRPAASGVEGAQELKERLQGLRHRLCIEEVSVSILCACILELQTWSGSVPHAREAQGDTISAMTRFSDAPWHGTPKLQMHVCTPPSELRNQEGLALWGEGGRQS